MTAVATVAKREIVLWRYVLPPEDNAYDPWAIVLMDSSGMFSTVSDYGNYAYKWSSFGERDFRQFIVGCDSDYVCGKIAPQREYDDEATLRAVKDEIIERRRDGARSGVPAPGSIEARTLGRPLTREEAREEWELLDRHEKLYCREAFALWTQDTRLDFYELARQRRSVQATMFCEKLLPRLQAMLKAEMEAGR